MAEITLYTAPNSYAMTVHAILEESGRPYGVKWVEIFTDAPDPEFVAVSPHARVPALVHGETRLCETGAIAVYLAECFPELELLISPGDLRRGSFLQWLHYLASTLQPDVMVQFHPENYFTQPDMQQQFMSASMHRLEKVLLTLNDALRVGPYFLGETRTVLDYLLVMQAVWPEIYPRHIDEYPNIRRLVDIITARDAVKRVVSLHESRTNKHIWPLS
tara:strand:+ start:361 stop:1014 length:654 start_codon:yes stop_codon:yes gene_type:complete